MTSSARKSISAKVRKIAVIVAVAAVTSLTLASALVTRNLELQHANILTRETADKISRASADATAAIITDAEILANMPPVAALIRAHYNNGIDPVSGDSTEEWKERLTTIFSSFHALRPNYLQIRFVGFADNAQEILRVDKVGERIERVPDDRLQQKGNEPYVEAARTVPIGQAVPLPPSYNRENGIIQEPKTLMYRVLVPVLEPAGYKFEGHRFGFIVINVDLLKHNQAAYKPLNLASSFVIHNSKGSSYVWDAEAQSGQYHGGMVVGLPEIVRTDLSRANAEQPLRLVNEGVEYITLKLESVSSATHSVFLTLIKERHFFSNILPFSTLNLIVLGLLLIFCSYAFARRGIETALAPMQTMRGNILASAETGQDPVLPIHLEDEVGDLAQSFKGLITRLRSQESDARQVFDGTTDGMVLVTSNGLIQQSNAAFGALFGPVVMGESTLTDYFASGDAQAIEAKVKLLASGNAGKHFAEAVLCRGKRDAKDGSSNWFEVTLALLREAEQKLALVVIRDVTEREAMSKSQKDLIEQLNRSNKDLEEFAYVASHDLKAPLRAVSHAATWLEEDLEEHLTEETTEHLHYMKSRILRMSGLLDDLLAHSKIGTRDFDPKSNIMSGLDLSHNIADLCGSGQDTQLEFSQDFLAAQMNQMPLQVVLLNLVSNAFKHNDKAQGHVLVALKDQGDHFEISVKDNGPGIHPKFQEAIFGLFRTLKSKDEVEGSGMGLAFVAKHLAVLGQSIKVISEGDGNGAEFVFTWPKPNLEEVQNVA